MLTGEVMQRSSQQVKDLERKLEQGIDVLLAW